MREWRADLEQVTAFAPATVTNVSCGFDIFGFALNAPGDEVLVRRIPTPEVRIRKISGDAGQIPLQTDRNTAGRALRAFWEALTPPMGFEIEIYKKMAIGTGLGSSAASAVAAVWAANRFLKQPLQEEALLPFVLEGEKLTSGGSVHADNVAAALFGGFVLVRTAQPPDIIPLHFPRQLRVAVVHPHIELPTWQMRRILREQVELKDAVRQWGNIAAFVAGLQNGDLHLMSRSLQDVIIEPVRGKVIPGYEAARQAAVENGALGSGISGSGPSMFALCPSESVARKAGEAMRAVFHRLNLQADLYLSPINPHGPKILEMR
jgi:homoserine kinase